MITAILLLLFLVFRRHRCKSISVWEYGTLNERVARRHRKTGECQFVLWEAGEQGHKEDYWHCFGAGHDVYFIPNE